MLATIKIYTKRDLTFEKGVWLDNETLQPINGIKRSFYPDGKVQDETTMQNGVPCGIQKVYDPMGNLWWENTWANNQLVRYSYFK